MKLAANNDNWTIRRFVRELACLNFTDPSLDVVAWRKATSKIAFGS
jgi:hypothetical protein